jgi:hypothetical protein
MKQRYLLGLVLLTPFLAQAYGGGGSISPGEGFLFVLVLLAPFVLPPTFLLWAYLRPRNRGVQLTQGFLIVGLAWLWSVLQQDRGVRSMEGVSFYFNALVPLALLLNGLTQARQAARVSTRLFWTGVAVTGGGSLVWQLLSVLLWRNLPGGQSPLLGWLVSVLVALSSWVVVLRLLRREPALGATLWHGPWWRTPAVVSGVGAVYTLVEQVLSTLYSSFISIAWSSMPLLLLYQAIIYLVAGIIALRLVSPLAPEPDMELEQPELTEG